MLIAALMSGVGLGSFATGALREWFTLEQLYRLSVIYPFAALTLAFLTRRAPARLQFASRVSQARGHTCNR